MEKLFYSSKSMMAYKESGHLKNHKDLVTMCTIKRKDKPGCAYYGFNFGKQRKQDPYISFVLIGSHLLRDC